MTGNITHNLDDNNDGIDRLHLNGQEPAYVNALMSAATPPGHFAFLAIEEWRKISENVSDNDRLVLATASAMLRAMEAPSTSLKEVLVNVSTYFHLSLGVRMATAMRDELQAVDKGLGKKNDDYFVRNFHWAIESAFAQAMGDIGHPMDS